MDKTFTAEILEDDTTGDLLIEIPQHLMQEMGWDYGTELDWKIQDGNIFLTEIKKED